MFLTLFYAEQVQILDNSVCQALYGIMTDNMMCTSGDNGRGTCYGDSGGPAVVKQPDGSYVQVCRRSKHFSVTKTYDNATI
jgi:hypothetical protein